MKRVFLSIVAATVMFVGCNADAEIEVVKPVKVDAPTFSASFGDETRTSYEENQGYAKWIENEHLSIFNLDNHNLKYYIHNVGNNGKTADMDYAEEYVEKSGESLDQNYAIYPYSEVNEVANGVIYSELPAVQTFDAESNFKNVPIVACSPDTSLSFSIPTAIYRYKVKKQDHPSKFYLKSITMTSASQNIAGAIEIDMTAESPVAVVTGDGKSVTLDLGENGVEITTDEQYFYIALPAISFPENDRTITCLVSKGGKDYQVVIEKDKAMTLEAGVVKSTSIELKATSFTANSVYPATGGELVGNLTLTSDFLLDQPLTVPAGEEATINLNGKNIINKAEGTDLSYFDIFYVEEGATLTINGDGNVEAVSGIEGYCVFAEGNVTINGGSYKSGKDAEGLTNTCVYARGNGNVVINGGEFESVDGTYVLNIKDADRGTASITVKGGKFYNFNPANNASEGAGTNFVADGYISVETSENVWEVFPATEPIEVASLDTLKSVLAQGGSVKLTENITASEIIVLSGNSTIDGNGKTLTSSAGRAINVSGADGATIKNLTIKASGERAINVIQNSTNITIDNVTASSANYTVNVASSAPNTNIVINNSDLTGLNTINVAGAGAVIEVNNSTITCDDQTEERFAAIALGQGATNAEVTVNDGEIVVNGNSVAGRCDADGTSITLNNVAGNNTIIYESYAVEYGDYYYSFATFEEAITIAQNGETIKITRDVVVEEPLVIPADKQITIELNGKSISQKLAQTTAYAMIVNKGTLTIKDSVGGGKVSYEDTSEYSADNGYASNTIRNEGTLTIESGIVENISSDNVKQYGYPHAIDVYQGSTTNIKGGTVKSANYDCIRMFCNSTTKATTVNISGGNIINRVTFQNPSSNQPGYGRLNISGGTFTTTDGVKSNVRLLNFSSDVSNMKAEVTGGTFDKGVSISNYSAWTANWDWLTIGNDAITKIE